jgi:hypothetical protein
MAKIDEPTKTDELANMQDLCSRKRDLLRYLETVQAQEHHTRRVWRQRGWWLLLAGTLEMLAAVALTPRALLLLPLYLAIESSALRLVWPDNYAMPIATKWKTLMEYARMDEDTYLNQMISQYIYTSEANNATFAKWQRSAKRALYLFGVINVLVILLVGSRKRHF